MKFKRILLSLITIAISMGFLLAEGVNYVVNAADEELYIKNLRFMTVNPNFGYSVSDPANGGATIWNIVQYDSPTISSYSNINSDIYCLKEGRSIGGSNNNSNGSTTYNWKRNMKTQKSAINTLFSADTEMKKVLDGTMTINGTSVNRYNAILAILDNIYLFSGTEGQDKINEINSEVVTRVQYEGTEMADYIQDYPLTASEIKAVQQVAIWYFTEDGTKASSIFKNLNDLWYTTSDNVSAYTQYSNTTNQRKAKIAGMNAYYNYLIEYAKNNASKYANLSSQSGVPAVINTNTLGKEESGSNYIIGPINITENENAVPYTIDFTVKNNGTGISYTLLDQNKASTSKTVKQLVGNNFYISVPKTSVSDLSINIKINYTNTTMNLWTQATNSLNQQPVVKVERTTTPISKTLTLDKKFDLALRKYITKVNGTDVANTRVPNITETNLANGTSTTATYKHRKDPVVIKTGDNVTYKLTVYNEGEKAGRATKIVDQLPTGLKYTRVVSGNFELDSYSETGNNTLTLKRKSDNTTNLPAYTSGNLTSGTGTETIEIECEVTQTPDTTNSKILTNVAWISEAIDSDGTVITNQQGKDRDSEPATTPDVNKDNMSDYKGNSSNKNDLTDSSFYYKGEQDDDDFEKLVVLPETFDLALRKYIVKVGDTELTGDNSRVPNVDESTLTTGTTATYKHRKDPVVVENGTKVVYKLTIYNEGTKAGRATKIVDQLPTGLKFTRVISGNFELDSYSETGDNKLTLKRKSDNTTNLPAYSSGELVSKGSETIEIECEVTASADTNTNKVLTNVAWISEAIDSDGTVITNQQGKDRDSEPATTPNVNKDNMSNYKGNTSNPDVTPANKNTYYKGEQDDDDFEKLVVMSEPFDLKLIKRITAVNDNPVPERIKSVDVSDLNRVSNGEVVATTAKYDLNKDPVPVKKGDIVTYTFRVYNEGMKDGYAQEITEDIPEGLQFIFVEEGATATDAEKAASEFNMSNGWAYADTTFKTIKTDKLSRENSTDNLITAFGKNDGTKTVNDLKYKEVQVKFKVVAENIVSTPIRNEASITNDCDKDGNDVEDRDSKPDEWVKYEDDEDYDNVVLQAFDLSLRKFIIAVSKDDQIEDKEYLKNTDGSYTRAPKVDTSKLNTIDSNGNPITTAIYEHPKTAVEVEKGDYVIYNLRVYNEGNMDGYATEITDHLPSNLEFISGAFNTQYGWTEVEGSNGRVYKTDYLKDTKIDAATIDTNGKVTQLATNEKGTNGKELLIMCKVIDTAPTDTKITNIADITGFVDENKQTVTDRDSDTDLHTTDGNNPDYKDTEIDRGDKYIPGQQDDDDFEKVIVKKRVDLALTKFITAVSTDAKIEDGEYLTPNKNIGSKTNEYTRATVADTTGLKAGTSTDATYTEKKDIEPLVVGKNSYVLYNIRVYNEGEVDVYAGEVTDYLPENLEFVDGEFNKQYGWTAEGQIVKTNYLSSKNGEDKILKAFDREKDNNAGSGLDYKDLPILCKVSDKAQNGKKLINTAEITKYEDKDGKDLPKDVDSTPENKEEKNVEKRDEDDDDYEVITIQSVDLALTKFIIAISEDTKIEDGEYLTQDKTSKTAYTRQTKVDSTELKAGTKTDAVYTRVKDPLLVNKGAYVLYNIRVYNEGDVDVYAGEVTDYLPENLSFVEGEFNKQYGWTAQGQVVKTSLLSSKNGEDKILKAFDREKDNNAGSGLDYKDLPILCQVNTNTPANKELVNTAEITKYEDKDGKDLPKDVDSTPENKKTKNDKNREEDDDDYEVVVVKEFDLSLRKWVTQAIVIENGKQTVTNTGHQPYDDPEQVVKVELHRKKINNVTVKFRYSIRITNEGDIAGYAKEITDYVPQGLRFIAADNPGWTDAGNNVIKTRLLENTLLQPGEYADVQVLLTWVNNENNMGVKTNTAEISEDYNEFGVPDKDSTPNNKKSGEDDIDDAPVMLSVSTGQIRIYFTLGFVVLITLAGGVVLIKKYVL